MALIDTAYLKLIFDSRRVDQLTDDGSGADASRAVAIIAAADAEVKAALSRQYTTGEIEADAGLKYVCACIAMQKLEMRKGSVPDNVNLQYSRALAILKDLISGELKLGAVAELLPSSYRGIAKTFEASELFAGLPELELE